MVKSEYDRKTLRAVICLIRLNAVACAFVHLISTLLEVMQVNFMRSVVPMFLVIIDESKERFGLFFVGRLVKT